MRKGYKTVAGLLRHGLKLPKIASEVAKEVKERHKNWDLKLKTEKLYRIHYYDFETETWLYSDPEWTLKSAKDKLKKYKLSHPRCRLVKVTQTYEIISK